jgi:hypothetical protein
MHRAADNVMRLARQSDVWDPQSIRGQFVIDSMPVNERLTYFQENSRTHQTREQPVVFDCDDFDRTFRRTAPTCITSKATVLSRLGYDVLSVNRVSRSWVPTLQAVPMDIITRHSLDAALSNFSHVVVPNSITQVVSNAYVENTQGISRLILLYSLTVPFSRNPTFMDILSIMNEVTGAAEDLKQMSTALHVDLKLVEDPQVSETKKSTDKDIKQTWTILLRFSIDQVSLQDITVCP